MSSPHQIKSNHLVCLTQKERLNAKLTLSFWCEMIPLFIVCIIIKDTMICNFTARNITILLKYCRYCSINGCFCSICYWYECEYQYRKLVSVFMFVTLTGLQHTSNKRSCFTAHAHLCSFYVDVRKAIVAVSALLNLYFALRSLSFVFFKSLHFWLFFFYRWVSLTAPPECLTVHTPKPPLWTTTPLIECLKRFVSWPPFNFETTSFIQCLEMH